MEVVNGSAMDPAGSKDRDDQDCTGGEVSRREARGTWWNAAYHLATTIATPAAFAPLPSAVAALGWEAGVIVLVVDTLVTCYCSLLLASLWEFEGLGQLNVTYGDLGYTVFGRTGYWTVAFFQQIASIGNNIAIQIVAGISMKAIYTTYNSGNWTLQEFIILFGVVEFLLSQLPDIHSLRKWNLMCTFCTIGFAICAIGLSIYNGKQQDRKEISYGLQGSANSKLFGIFSALGTMAFSFGDAMLPEIQATVKEPAKLNMYKGVGLAFSVIALTYWPVAFVGYWAFGSSVQPYLVNSFTGPKWVITMANVFAVIQVSGCYQIYCRPTYEYFEIKYLDPKQGPYAKRNLCIRLFITGVYMIIMTLIAAAMPFFGDFVALCGAIGFTPLDFVIPILAFLKVRRPQSSLVWFVNVAIVVVYSVVAVLGSIGAIKFIIKDTQTYKFFNNM